MECSYHGKSVFTKRIESIWIESEFDSNSSSHLFGSFVRKCYTKNRARIYSFVMNHWNYSFSNSMCFSWTSSSIDEEWSIDGFYSFLLLRIELWHMVYFSRRVYRKEWKKRTKILNLYQPLPYRISSDFFLHFLFFHIYLRELFYIYLLHPWISLNSSARVRESNFSKNL